MPSRPMHLTAAATVVSPSPRSPSEKVGLCHVPNPERRHDLALLCVFGASFLLINAILIVLAAVPG